MDYFKTADGKIDYFLPGGGALDQSEIDKSLDVSVKTSKALDAIVTFGGNKAGTADHSFNAFGLLNTGLAFAPQVSNLLAARVGASTFPFQTAGPLQRLQVGTDIFLFGKLRHSAPIDEPSTGDRYLGAESDFFLNWQITNDVSISTRYGIFAPGSGVIANDHPRQVFFFGVTYAY
jgi:hypothetical protein